MCSESSKTIVLQLALLDELNRLKRWSFMPLQQNIFPAMPLWQLLIQTETFPKSSKTAVFCRACILQNPPHAYVCCMHISWVHLTSLQGMVYFLEVCFNPRFHRDTVSGIQNKNHHMILKEIQFRMSWRYYDLVGADIPRLCTKLTIPVRSRLLRWTQTWHEEMQLLFLVLPLIKVFYPKRFKQIGLILRSISFNPWMVFVSSTRKESTWEGIGLCVTSKLLKTHSLTFSTVKTDNKSLWNCC